ncbi:MAG TPA: hypothetical protein VM597_05740, partial [Gemmataceae bacterium]|nr:hypothetical protein [Gemmataceae bacterium]
MAFLAEAALPAGVRGPVEREAFSLFASSCRSLAMGSSLMRSRARADTPCGGGAAYADALDRR